MNLVEALGKLIRVLISAAWRFVKKYALSIALLTAGISLLFTVYREYRENRTLGVSFLSGPRSSKAASESREIAGIANSLPTRFGIGRRYRINPIYTDGFLDNYRRVASSGFGVSIGYCIDGLCNERNSRARLLLPLESNYLHFMCRNDFLDDCWTFNKLSAATDLAARVSTGEAEGIEICRLATRCKRPIDTPYALTQLRGAIQTATTLRSAIRFRLANLANHTRKSGNSTDKNVARLPGPDPDAIASSGPGGGGGAGTDPPEEHPALEATNKKPGGAEEQILRELGQAADAIVGARFYLGPTDSGSRELASQVFKHIQMDPGVLSATGILDYTEMRRALRDGKIAGGLLVAALNAATVGGVAKDGKCSLVSIDTAPGIDAGGSATDAGKILKNTYHRANRPFCPADVLTLKTRRLLIASEDLSTVDAFKIARLAAEFHGIDPTSKALWNDTGEHPASGHLTFRRHPATYVLQEGTTPTAWLLWEHPLVQTIAPALLLAVLINGIAYVTGLLSPVPVAETTIESAAKKTPRKRRKNP